MKKDIEWMKEEINNMKLKGQSIRPKKINNKLDVVLGLIDQLDEPEVLSQEWIDRNKEPFHHFETKKVDYYVSTDFLQNLLVPKQELPAIPKFVADYLDFAKSDTTLMRVLELANTRNELEIWEKEYDWIEENHELFARAWLDGCEVAEEPLYRARLKVITDEFIASYLRTQSSDAEDRLKALEIGSKYIHEDYRHLSEFTEDELKRLNIWDSEQWEVEELED